MTITVYVLVAIAVGFAVLSWLVGRISERLHHPLAVTSGIVTRLCLGTAFALIAAQEAMHGGYAWIAFSFCAFAALWSLGMSGVLVWSWATGKLDDTEPAGGD